MKQFSLEKWLKDKGRKVVTRDGREVEIFYSTTSRIPLIGKVSDSEFHQYTKDGFQCDTFNQAKNDLFFADEEGLTEFEKAIYQHICTMVTACDGKVDGDEILKPVVKGIAKDLLDLARKEILKDLPKWKRATENKEFEKHVCVMDYYMSPFLDTEVNEGDYYIELSDLKTLSKE